MPNRCIKISFGDVCAIFFVLYRERYEMLLEKEEGDMNVSGHHQSRDSAIDTELQECETEICEIDLVNNNFTSCRDFHSGTAASQIV